jgi:hypothetical protein
MPSKKTRRGEPWTLAELELLAKSTESILARRTRRTIKEIVVMRELPPATWQPRPSAAGWSGLALPFGRRALLCRSNHVL